MEEKDRAGSDDDENEQWILDSLVMYLRGPIWNVPILNFIDEKSVIFESGHDHENEYRRVHDEFRNLVDAMLGAYMDDLCLQPENLEMALSQIQPSVRSAALQELLEPVQSAGDYVKFKELMRNKNEDLHRQAMELLVEQGKAHPPPFAAPPNSVDESSDDRDLKEAIRLSIAEQEALRKDVKSEEHDVERALAISLAGMLTQVAKDEQDSYSSRANSATTTTTTTTNQLREEKRDAGPDPSEVERRRKLLREQRDKILRRKREERELQMRLHEKQSGPGLRPKSGSVARAALAGQTARKVDDKTLQYRRLLLQKIQEEVKNPEVSQKSP